MPRGQVDEWLEAMAQTSICGLGQGAPIPVRNAFRHWPELFEPALVRSGSGTGALPVHGTGTFPPELDTASTTDLCSARSSGRRVPRRRRIVMDHRPSARRHWTTTAGGPSRSCGRSAPVTRPRSSGRGTCSASGRGQRFLLSDAQFVVAREQQHRVAGPTLEHALEARGADPGDRLQRVALALAHARAGCGRAGRGRARRGRRLRRRRSACWCACGSVAPATRSTTTAAPSRRAGRPPGWLVRRRGASPRTTYWLNVNRRGTVFVPAVETRRRWRRRARAARGRRIGSPSTKACSS